MFFFCLLFKDNLSNLLNFFPSVQTCCEVKVFSGERVRLCVTEKKSFPERKTELLKIANNIFP